jgi:hypothetical protein
MAREYNQQGKKDAEAKVNALIKQIKESPEKAAVLSAEAISIIHSYNLPAELIAKVEQAVDKVKADDLNIQGKAYAIEANKEAMLEPKELFAELEELNNYKATEKLNDLHDKFVNGEKISVEEYDRIKDEITDPELEAKRKRLIRHCDMNLRVIAEKGKDSWSKEDKDNFGKIFEEKHKLDCQQAKCDIVREGEARGEPKEQIIDKMRADARRREQLKPQELQKYGLSIEDVPIKIREPIKAKEEDIIKKPKLSAAERLAQIEAENKKDIEKFNEKEKTNDKGNNVDPGSLKRKVDGLENLADIKEIMGKQKKNDKFEGNSLDSSATKTHARAQAKLNEKNTKQL